MVSATPPNMLETAAIDATKKVMVEERVLHLMPASPAAWTSMCSTPMDRMVTKKRYP